MGKIILTFQELLNKVDVLEHGAEAVYEAADSVPVEDNIEQYIKKVDAVLDVLDDVFALKH